MKLAFAKFMERKCNAPIEETLGGDDWWLTDCLFDLWLEGKDRFRDEEKLLKWMQAVFHGFEYIEE